MALGSGDILLYTSTVAGSTGGAISANTVTSGVVNNVWPDITDAERIAGGTRYRKVFWKNNSATDAAILPVMYAPVLPTNMTLSLGFGFSHADDGDSLQGNMSAFGAAAKAALVSDGADTRVVTIVGLDNAGTPAPVSENVTLTGAVEVLSVATFSKVWGFYVASLDAARTVTLKQGAGGTTRGTIGTSKKIAWLWVVSPSTKAAGIGLPNLALGTNCGLWMRLAWNAGAASVRPNTTSLSLEENA